MFHTLSSAAFKRSEGEHATNVGCQAADRLYDRMAFDHMRRAAVFSTDCIRSSRHVCRPYAVAVVNPGDNEDVDQDDGGYSRNEFADGFNPTQLIERIDSHEPS